MNLDWVKSRREEIAAALFGADIREYASMKIWNTLSEQQQTCVVQLLATEALIEANRND